MNEEVAEAGAVLAFWFEEVDPDGGTGCALQVDGVARRGGASARGRVWQSSGSIWSGS